MRALTRLVSILAILPALLTAISKAVQEFEVEGNGDKKKQAVLDVIGVSFDTFEQLVVDTPLTKEDVVKLSDGLIDVVVGFYNAIGKFTH